MKKYICFVLLLCISSLIQAETKQTIELVDGTEISYYHYPAKGKQLYIWLAPEAGLQQSERDIAKQLAAKGVEVWYPDLFETNFLPIAASSVERFPVEQIKALIASANKGKDIYLITSGRGVVPMLKGLRQWQIEMPASTAIKGVILLSAKFFVETPEPGQAGKLLPIVRATNIPVYLFQPAQSPWRWKLDETIPALQQGGSEVFLQILNNVRDRFYYRPDAVATEYQLAGELPRLIIRAANVLASLSARRTVAKLNEVSTAESARSKKARKLTAYLDRPATAELQLKDLNGNSVNLNDFKDQVVMVNFWASWCPPCVYEMPSMQRLKESMKGKPFQIIAVNMAEERSTIEKFLKENVKVDFTILLDSNGKALKRWKVFAFPTTYFVGKQGRLRYGFFGGREWDKPDVQHVIEKLINE